MGGIVSKKKFSLKRNKKKNRDRNEHTYVNMPLAFGASRIGEESAEIYEEPVYMEIGPGVEFSTGSRSTLQSSDSAFSERNSTLTRSSNSSICTVLYEEPGASLNTKTVPKQLYQTSLSLHGDGADTMLYIDDDVSDVHTYISDVSDIYGTKIPIEEVPYMVEAFQPLLEQTIDVMEVVPHMPFIDVHEFVRVYDQRKAVEMLIARIKASNEPGKWQAFLQSLSMTGYKYIVSLLRGETEEDHSVNRAVLRLFTPQLIDRIDPEEFIDHLLGKNVINERDMEEVRCEKERRGAIAASFMLLHKVPRRIANWYEVFLEVLSQCGLEDVVQHLRVPEFSVSTTTLTKQKCIKPKKKKLKESSRRKLMDTDLYYITPTNSTEEHLPYFSCSRNPPPLPGRSQFSLPYFDDTLLKQRQTVNDSYSGKHSKTDLELLREKKHYLKKKVEEKKLMRKLNREVNALQKELEELHKDEEDSDDTANEDRQSNATVHENSGSNGEAQAIEKDEENKTESFEIDVENFDNEKAVYNEDNGLNQYINMNDDSLLDIFLNSNSGEVTEGQVKYEEHISKLFTDMKQEFKQDILAMRDHVTDAVLKYITSSTTRATSLDDNTYVTVEVGQTIPQSPVKLYSSSSRQYPPGMLCPASHYITRHYSVDSAMFSDYVPASDFTS